MWCDLYCREDGTYNIEFDDKEIFKEFKVPASRIRKVSKQEREREREIERESMKGKERWGDRAMTEVHE
jgi:hypothetical protein